MEKKDFNEVFDMMHKEAMDKAKKLLTELIKRAMLVRAMAQNDPDVLEVGTWEQLKEWVMHSCFKDVAEVTKYLIALIDLADDYRDLPEPFEDIFTKQEDERPISDEVLSVFNANAYMYNEWCDVDEELLSVEGFDDMADLKEWALNAPESEVLNLVRYMASWE